MFRVIQKKPAHILLTALFLGTIAAGWSSDHPFAAASAANDPLTTASPYLPQATGREVRTALRLQKRIGARHGFLVALQDVLRGMREQKSLLSQSMEVTFAADDGETLPTWNAGTAAHAEWLSIVVTPAGLFSSVDAGRIEESLRQELPPGIMLPVGTVIRSVKEEKGVIRVETDGVAKHGYEFDHAAVARLIAMSLEQKLPAAVIALKKIPGTIVNDTVADLGELKLLASGHSNFEGSGLGRKANVRKGLNEKIHNILVQPGEEFSMYAILRHVPINEWEVALGIFNGDQLRPVLGGGLCQVATTVYRAVLNAGLPITKRAPHSLFVSYYVPYGLGLDAAYFPGQQDLTFKNDTENPILIQAFTEGDEATVSIYGTPDGRTVDLKGPYLASSAPPEFRVNQRKLQRNEIAWERSVHYADGTKNDQLILSRYKEIPKSVVTKYLHAAGEMTLQPIQ